MCFSSTTDTTSQNSSNNPAWLNRASKGVANDITQAMGQGYQKYAGPTQGAFGQTFGVAENDATQRAATMDPNFAAGGSALAQALGLAGATASTPVEQLMSRYTDAVLQPTIQGIQRQAASDNEGLGTNATMSGAFGDSGYATQKALNDRNTQENIANATGAAYDRAYSNALNTQQQGLSQLLSGVGQASNLGSAEQSARTSLDALLASMGSTKQQANQQGINTAIGVNDSNNMGLMRLLQGFGGTLGSLPHDSYQTGSGTETKPDNTLFGALGSLGAGALGNGWLSSLWGGGGTKH